MTASLVGQVLGIAAFVGAYLGAAPDRSAHALAVTIAVLAVALVVTAACAFRAVAAGSRPHGREARRWLASVRRS